MHINTESRKIVALFIQFIKMDASSLFNVAEYIRAAPDAQLSSSETHLLATLITEEDQYDYNQLLTIQLSHDILHLLHQVRSSFSFRTLSSYSTVHLANFTSSSFLIFDKDGHCLTQKTHHSQTFYRFINNHCLCHTLIQISRFTSTNYRLRTHCSMLSY
jgi:hypothetical protein